MSARLPWTIAIALAVACSFLAFRVVNQPIAAPPRVVTKEVVREVPKEVIREVPKEVIREVPKEVLREVIKEVPAQIPEDYRLAKAFATRFLSAERVVENDSILKGVPSVNVSILLSKNLNGRISQNELRDSIELSLRRNGIPVKADAGHTLWFIVEGLWDDKMITFSYSAALTLDTDVFLFTEDKVRVSMREIWRYGYVGMAGSAKVQEGIRTTADKLVISFSNKYLAQNPR